MCDAGAEKSPSSFLLHYDNIECTKVMSSTWVVFLFLICLLLVVVALVLLFLYTLPTFCLTRLIYCFLFHNIFWLQLLEPFKILPFLPEWISPKKFVLAFKATFPNYFGALLTIDITAFATLHISPHVQHVLLWLQHCILDGCLKSKQRALIRGGKDLKNALLQNFGEKLHFKC